LGSETKETPRKFLLDCARFYRGLGFFAKHASLSDEELADELDRIRQEDWEYHLDPNNRMDEMVLASWDEDRVWWEDAYEWLGELGTMYTDALQGWARISRGAFRPTDIVETWASPDGPVDVEFAMDGVRYRFAPAIEGSPETLDTNLLGALNALIAPTNLHFEAVDTTDQTAYLVVVTAEERAALARRGWPFQDWIPAGPVPPKAPTRTPPARPVEPEKRRAWFSRK
jgi:hypothetical protein